MLGRDRMHTGKETWKTCHVWNSDVPHGSHCVLSRRAGFLRWSEISAAPPRRSARNLSKHAGPRATGVRLRRKSACSARQNTLCIQLYKQIRGLAVAASLAFYVLSREKLEMTRRFVSSLFSVFQQSAGRWLTACSQRGFIFPARFHQFRPADLWF